MHGGGGCDHSKLGPRARFTDGGGRERVSERGVGGVVCVWGGGARRVGQYRHARAKDVAAETHPWRDAAGNTARTRRARSTGVSSDPPYSAVRWCRIFGSTLLCTADVTKASTVDFSIARDFRWPATWRRESGIQSDCEAPVPSQHPISIQSEWARSRAQNMARAACGAISTQSD